MPRVPKNVDLTESHRSRKEIETRKNVEDLFGAELTKDLKPSNRLNANQKKLFKFIADHHKSIGVLGDIDGIMLELTVIAIDRLQSIEKLINEDFDQINNRELMAAKSKYTTDFLKGVEMFGMSPSARAKFGILAAQKAEQETDPLLKVLKSS
jgi:phage terminase small subunit